MNRLLKLTITKCEDCPRFQKAFNNTQWRCGANNRIMRTDDREYNIPDWCPLPVAPTPATEHQRKQRQQRSKTT